MLAEGELRSNLDESDRVRDLQDKVADLKAEVSYHFIDRAYFEHLAKNSNFIRQ